jgi:hypothetical protein
VSTNPNPPCHARSPLFSIGPCAFPLAILSHRWLSHGCFSAAGGGHKEGVIAAKSAAKSAGKRAVGKASAGAPPQETSPRPRVCGADPRRDPRLARRRPPDMDQSRPRAQERRIPLRPSAPRRTTTRHGSKSGSTPVGHMHVLRWARENGAPWNAWTRYYAALGGHSDATRTPLGRPLLRRNRRSRKGKGHGGFQGQARPARREALRNQVRQQGRGKRTRLRGPAVRSLILKKLFFS